MSDKIEQTIEEKEQEKAPAAAPSGSMAFELSPEKIFESGATFVLIISKAAKVQVQCTFGSDEAKQTLPAGSYFLIRAPSALLPEAGIAAVSKPKS